LKALLLQKLHRAINCDETPELQHYFTYVRAYAHKVGQKYINKQGYGLDRKGTWKCGKCLHIDR